MATASGWTDRTFGSARSSRATARPARRSLGAAHREAGLMAPTVWQPPAWLEDADRAREFECLRLARAIVEAARARAEAATDAKAQDSWRFRIELVNAEMAEALDRLKVPTTQQEAA